MLTCLLNLSNRPFNLKPDKQAFGRILGCLRDSSPLRRRETVSVATTRYCVAWFYAVVPNVVGVEKGTKRTKESPVPTAPISHDCQRVRGICHVPVNTDFGSIFHGANLDL